MEKYLFFALTETWLSDHIDAELKIPGYKLYRADRVRKKKRGRNSGGVAVYVQDNLASSCECILNVSNGVIETLVLYSQKENLAIVVIYRQPDDKSHGNISSSPQFTEIIDKVNKVISQINSPTPDIIIGGDFNLPHINWLDNSFDKKCKKDEKIMFEKVFELCNNFQLNQYVNKPTHKDGNILDLLFTNNDNLIHNLNVIPTILNVSHHSIIQCSTL